jgi:hypothetical protein
MASAKELIRLRLKEWGLEGLTDVVWGWRTVAATEDEWKLLLREQEAWKKRFAGNEMRKKAGLAVMSEAEYIATEDAYKQVLSSYGMGGSQFDSMDAYARLIAGQVSPQEMASRVGEARKMVDASDPSVRAEMARYYGIGDADLLTYFLDPKVGAPELENRARTARVGGMAASSGMRISRQQAEDVVSSDPDRSGRYESALQSEALMFEGMSGAAARFDQSWDSEDAVDAVLSRKDARAKKGRLASQERALFSGESGIGRDSLIRDSQV